MLGFWRPDLQFANVSLTVNQALRVEAALSNHCRAAETIPAAVNLSLNGPGMCLRGCQELTKRDISKRRGVGVAGRLVVTHSCQW